MKKKRKKHKSVLHYTIQLCWLKRRQQKARVRLLNAIKRCTSRNELEQILAFADELQEEQDVQQAYYRRRAELQHQSAA